MSNIKAKPREEKAPFPFGLTGGGVVFSEATRPQLGYDQLLWPVGYSQAKLSRSASELVNHERWAAVPGGREHKSEGIACVWLQRLAQPRN